MKRVAILLITFILLPVLLSCSQSLNDAQLKIAEEYDNKILEVKNNFDNHIKCLEDAYDNVTDYWQQLKPNTLAYTREVMESLEYVDFDGKSVKSFHNDDLNKYTTLGLFNLLKEKIADIKSQKNEILQKLKEEKQQKIVEASTESRG